MRKKWFVVCDGKNEKEYDFVGNIIFSPDSNHLAYAAQNGSKQFIVVDKNEEGDYSSILNNSLAFSPNSKRIVYSANIRYEKKLIVLKKYIRSVIVDGKIGAPYLWIIEDSIKFSPDSRRIAYFAQNSWKKEAFGVIDSIEQKKYKGLDSNSFIFSPDSKHFAYGAFIDKKWVVIKDGSESDSYDTIGGLPFSPDSKRFAYWVELEKKRFAVIDGNVSDKKYDIFLKGEHTFLFSDDSQKVAYCVQKDDQFCLIVDGYEGNWYPKLISKVYWKSLDVLQYYISKNGNDIILITDNVLK